MGKLRGIKKKAPSPRVSTRKNKHNFGKIQQFSPAISTKFQPREAEEQKNQRPKRQEKLELYLTSTGGAIARLAPSSVGAIGAPSRINPRPEFSRSDTAKRDGRESRKEEEDKGKPPRPIKIVLVHHLFLLHQRSSEREDEDLLFFNRQPNPRSTFTSFATSHYTFILSYNLSYLFN